MDAQRESVGRRREAVIGVLADAFQRRDFDAFREPLRPDLVLTLPGSSWLAGIYHGYEPFARYLLALRQVLMWPGEPITFSHHGHDMTFRQSMVVSGPNHEAEMALIVTVTFDEDEKIRSFFVQPKDQGLFDYVLNSVVERSSRVL
jgi:ketosteroid isomerase-like protein